jgi:hypothetical protein
LTVDRVKLRANEIKPRLRKLKQDALRIEPRFVQRINEIGTALSEYKNEILDQKQFLMEFLNEFYYDVEAYLQDVKPQLNLTDDEVQAFFERSAVSLTERYWYGVALPRWFHKDDFKQQIWVDKLLSGEEQASDRALILSLTQVLNARLDGCASHRYILDLSMATDLLASHVPCSYSPVFVQLKGIPIFRDNLRNSYFMEKQQSWTATCSYWEVERALLISHSANVTRPENQSSLADVILEESRNRPDSFVFTLSFPGYNP